MRESEIFVEYEEGVAWGQDGEEDWKQYKVQCEADAKVNTPILEVVLQTIQSISRDREGVGSLGNNSEGLLNVEASIEIKFEVGAVKVQS